MTKVKFTSEDENIWVESDLVESVKANRSASDRAHTVLGMVSGAQIAITEGPSAVIALLKQGTVAAAGHGHRHVTGH